MTVAMILASKGIIPSKEWYHNPELKCHRINIGGKHYQDMTVAMLLAINGIIPSKEWWYDPNLERKHFIPNIYGYK